MKKLVFMLFTLLMLAGCGTVSDLPAYGSLVNGGLPGFNFNVESCTGNAAGQKVNVTIVISHRLANVVPADNIYYMEDGEVKESGTHAELMRVLDNQNRIFSGKSACSQ